MILDEMKEEVKRGENILFTLVIILVVFFISIIVVAPITTSYTKTGTAYNCSDCSDCSAAITNANPGDTVFLNTSLSGLGGNCITYGGKNNVIFDCQGNSIYGINGGSNYGFNYPGNNSVIKNCNLSGFDIGINAVYSNNISIYNTTTYNNDASSYKTGILLNGVNFGRVFNVTTGSNVIAIEVSSSNNVNITGTYSFNDSYPIYISGSNNTNINNMTANNFSVNGVAILYSSNITLTNGVFNNGSQYFVAQGLDIQSSTGLNISNVITNNVPMGVYIQANTNNSIFTNITVNISKPSYGFYIKSSSNNTFANILVLNSTQPGIELQDSNNNTLTNITSYNNQIGLYLESSNNSMFRNIMAANSSSSGIYLSSIPSIQNNFTNVTASNNAYMGLYVYYSYGNNFANVTTNYNAYNGLDVEPAGSGKGNNFINVISQENQLNDLYAVGNSVTDCKDNFTNVTGSGNRPIFYYNYSVNIQNQSLSELIFCNAANSNISNITIAGSDTLNNNGFFLMYVNRLNISNLNSSNNYYGIYAPDLTNSTLNNLILNNNTQSGLDVEYSNLFPVNNTLTNIVSSYNAQYGLYFSTVENFTVKNVTSNNNSKYGIYLYSSNRNNLTNASVCYNNWAGVYLYASSSNTFIGMNLSYNNLTGINLTYASQSNTLKNSYIQNNNQYGITFWSSGINYPNSNYIYNNYFNNTINYNATAATYINFFNITKTPGTNIINNTYIGGNFWANPNGTGYSQNCSLDANSDGICDVPYTLDYFDSDALPLYSTLVALLCTENWACTDWSVCIGGTQSRACSDLNACGTIVFKPTESQSCSGGGGSSGGTTQSTQSTNSASPSSPAELTISNPGIDVIKLSINVLTTVDNLSVTVTKVDLPTADVQIGLPSGQSYQAFQIVTNANEADIANATINFKVNKTWMTSQNGTIADVRLYRKPTGETQWNPLPTTFSSEDANYYYFNAVSPGFSTFVVFFGKYECQPGLKRCYNEESQLCLGNATWLITEKCRYGCDAKGDCLATAPQSFIVYMGVIAIVSIGIVITFYLILTNLFDRRRKKQ